MLGIFNCTCVIISRVIWHWELRQWVVRSDNIMYSCDWCCCWFLTVTSFRRQYIRLHLRRVGILSLSLVQLLTSPHVMIRCLHNLLFMRSWQRCHVIRNFLRIFSSSESTVLRHWDWILRDWTLHQEFAIFNANAWATVDRIFYRVVWPCYCILCRWVTHLCSHRIWRSIRHIMWVFAKLVFLSLVHSFSIFIFLNY